MLGLLFDEQLFQFGGHFRQGCMLQPYLIAVFGNCCVQLAPVCFGLVKVEAAMRTTAFLTRQSTASNGFRANEHVAEVAAQVPAWIVSPITFDADLLELLL